MPMRDADDTMMPAPSRGEPTEIGFMKRPIEVSHERCPSPFLSDRRKLTDAHHLLPRVGKMLMIIEANTLITIDTPIRCS